MRREIKISIEWASNGLPLKSVDQNAHLMLDVASGAKKTAEHPDLPPQIGTVSLSGNRAGLLALAERLMAVAYTEVESYHEHLDNECPAGLLETDGTWELLIERSDRRAIRKAIRDGG